MERGRNERQRQTGAEGLCKWALTPAAARGGRRWRRRHPAIPDCLLPPLPLPGLVAAGAAPPPTPHRCESLAAACAWGWVLLHTSQGSNTSGTVRQNATGAPSDVRAQQQHALTFTQLLYAGLDLHGWLVRTRGPAGVAGGCETRSVRRRPRWVPPRGAVAARLQQRGSAGCQGESLHSLHLCQAAHLGFRRRRR